jgi:hypothetical protein
MNEKPARKRFRRSAALKGGPAPTARKTVAKTYGGKSVYAETAYERARRERRAA